MSLRSGFTRGNPPEQKYLNASDVFKKETREEFKKKYPNLTSAREAQKKAWEALSDKQKEKYTKLYEASVQEFEDNLVLHYGGTKKDVAAAQEINKIPPKPKHPLNAYFLYLEEHRNEFMKQNPDVLVGDVAKQMSMIYNELTDKQKKPYETQARKESEEYHKELAKWESQYGKQFMEGQKVLKDQQKYHSQGRKKALDYQEILSHKQKRKLVPLGEEETKQVEGRGRGRPKADKPQQQDQQNARKSISQKRVPSRSPSSNPKAQQENQKGGRGRGRGKPKGQKEQKEQKE